MQLIACSILLLVILEETYCKTTVTVNQTSTSWGYDYSQTDTSGYKVKHDRTGYHFEPYNNPSSSLKKHYNSSSVYDQFTSPGTNTSIRHSNATNYVINGIPNGNTHSRANITVSADKEQTTDFRTLPIVKTQTVTVEETRAPTGPMYYQQAPTYGQTYGPVGGSVYGIPNGQMNMPPPSPLYGSAYGQPAGPMNGNAPYGYGPQNGLMYGPQNGPLYGPQNGAMYGPQNGPIYGPQNGQIYGPATGQGYPTGSLYGSLRNY